MPVEKAIRIIGGKWKLLVLRSLLLNGPQRYNELLSSVTAISPKETYAKFARVDKHRAGGAGLWTRRLARYDLTKLGKGLMPTFKKLLTWGRSCGLEVVYAHLVR